MVDARSAPAWKYPVRALGDAGIMVLGFLVATWPIILVAILLKLLL